MTTPPPVRRGNAEVRGEPKQMEAPFEPQHAPNVLWIDDEVLALRPLKTQLETHGLRVTSCASGDGGLLACRLERYDAVLLDLNLPGLSGLEVLKRLRRDDLITPIIVLTGFGDLAAADDAMRLGAQRFLTKPIAPKALVRVLDEAIFGGHSNPALEDVVRDLTRSHLCINGPESHLIPRLLALLTASDLSVPLFYALTLAARRVLCPHEATDAAVMGRLGHAITRAWRWRLPMHSRTAMLVAMLEDRARRQPALREEEFAGQVSMSRIQLTRLLSETGMSFSDWRIGFVLIPAVRAILVTDEHIRQIAYSNGYKHVSQFNRAMSGLFGVSPSGLRRSGHSERLDPRGDVGQHVKV
jgi:DNA-binding response OmpR family regulator